MVKADQSESATTRKQSRSSSSSSAASSSSTPGSVEASLRQHQLLNPNNQRKEPSPFGCFINALTRKKPLDCRTDTSLNRCLNLVDLTALGK